MVPKKIFELLKNIDVIALLIPVGVITASVFMPLRPIVRQALICVIMVWFGVEAMTGFHVLK